MYRLTLKQLWRDLKRNRGNHLINILGLTISTSTCLLILMFIFNELTYDRHFREADNLYRVYFKGQMGGNYLEAATTGGTMGKILNDEIPEVLNFTRFIQYPRSVLLDVNGNKFYQENILFADSTFFQLFDYEFIEGDPSSALVNPKSIIMTEPMALKYFGSEMPLGKMIRWNNEDSYMVTGVIRPPANPTHLAFDILVSHSTLRDHPTYRNYIDNLFTFMTYNYLILQPGTDIRGFDDRIAGVVEKYMGEDMKAIGADLHYFIQPVKRIHLHSHLIHELKENGHVSTVWVFAGIAWLILLTACINFINLTTARSSYRAMEVGIKKIFGADRKILFRNFMSETLSIALISMVLSILVVEALAPFVGNQFDHTMHLSGAVVWWIVPGLILFTLLIAFLAGIYPALFLSAFRPIQVIRGNLIRGRKNPLFRNVMVTIQFIITIFLISSTLIIYQQLRYLNRTDLGFNADDFIITPLRSQKMVKAFETIKGELFKLPGVLEVTAFSAYPGNFQQRRGYYPEGQPASNLWMIRNVQVDNNFLHAMDIRLEDGRDFSPTETADSASIIINRSLARKMEWDAPLGKHIRLPGADGNEGQRFTIVGVTEDFHFASLREQVEPLIIHIDPGNFRYIGIRIDRNDITHILSKITEKWEEQFPDYPFDYFFLDDEFSGQYASEARMAGVFTNFTYLAVFIACLGLFGLVSFMIARRTHEIGIRKILGADSREILTLVNADFISLVIIASLISLPLSVYAMYHWLENFAYHTQIAWWNLFIAVLITTLLAISIISSIAYRAATKNPVKSLKYE